MKFVFTSGYEISIIVFLYIISINCALAKITIDTTLKRKKIIALPIIYYTPDTRWGIGAAGVFTFNFKKDSTNARHSNLSFGFAITQNKQVSFYLPYQLYLYNRKIWIYGELGYYKYIYSFYGIGNNTTNEFQEKYSVCFPRIRISPLIKIKSSHYLGLRFSCDQFYYTQYDSLGKLVNHNIVGSSSGTSSNIGIIYNFDSRDIQLYPAKGVLFESYLYAENYLLGSNYQFSKLSFDFAKYFSLKKNLILVTNIINQMSFGRLPFHQMPTIGGTKKLRGYIDGRYRDNMLFLIQSELRFKFSKYLGSVLFCGLGKVAPKFDQLNFKNIHPNIGVGLRVVLDQKQQYNLRLDYGFGYKSKGFYLTLGEAF